MPSRFDDNLIEQIVAIGREVPAPIAAVAAAALCDGDISRALRALPKPAQRAALETCIRAWRAADESRSLEGLAWAIRAAAATDDSWRDSQRLELVWTGPSDSGEAFRRTDQALLELIDAAREELWIVSFVAYRIPSSNAALTRALARSVTISLVPEPISASGGRITHDAVAAIDSTIRQHSAIYIWPDEARPVNDRDQKGMLHAKCALADTRKLLVSSANLTEAAMELNMEMGVMITGGAMPQIVRSNLRRLVADEILTRVKDTQ